MTPLERAIERVARTADHHARCDLFVWLSVGKTGGLENFFHRIDRRARAFALLDAAKRAALSRSREAARA